MSRQCDFPIEDLIDYADGLLAGERKTAVEAHLRDCPAFASDECFRPTISDGCSGRTLLRPEKHHTSGVLTHRRRSAPRWWLAFAAAALLMFIAVALEPATSLADFRLERFVAFITESDSDSPENLPGDQEPPGTLVESFQPSDTGLDTLWNAGATVAVRGPNAGMNGARRELWAVAKSPFQSGTITAGSLT